MSDETSQGKEPVWPEYLAELAVQKMLAFAEKVAHWNENALYGIELYAPERDHMATIAFAIVHEHHLSMTKLTRLGLVGSATALMRPAFESFVRGIWLTCADDQELTRFQKGHESADPEKLIRTCIKLTKRERYQDLLDTWKESKSSLHGFVHHNYQSLLRRSGTIDVPASEIVDLLRFSACMALHASVEIMELARIRIPEKQVKHHLALVTQRQNEVFVMLDHLGYRV